MAGFEDTDDCDRLCRDGILKMCAGLSASDEIGLASQPTMTRLENRLSRKELFDIGEAFIDDFIASYNSEPDFWKHPQRVVVKIEVSSLGTNVRYVVTDFKGQRSSFIYSECYCDRV